MRNPIYRMERGDALAFLERAPFVRLATTAPDGAPILRTVNTAVVDGGLVFHGAPAGEKMLGIGREVVVQVDEVIASVPSYFVDPERACPATTYYLSVQLHGVLERVSDGAAKARALTALMEQLQPEGGYRPLDAADPLYRNAIRGLLVARVSLEKLTGKAKLGQNRTPAELTRVIERLWQRGEPGDPRAIDLVRRANPGVPLPDALRLVDGADPRLALGDDDLAEATALLDGAYWLDGVSADRIARAHRAATAWIGARDRDGALIATARAVSDRARVAWLYDVMIAPAWRGRGLGGALVRLLLDHPAVRGAATVRLGTRDAQPFYDRFGFVEVASFGSPFPHAEMVLRR